MADINLEFYDYSFVYIDAPDGLFREIRDYFSFFADGYQFSNKFKYGTWDGKIRLIENDRLLPIGLVTQLCKFASNNDLSIAVHHDVKHKNNLSRDQFDTWVNSMTYWSGNHEIMPYWYQMNAVYEALVHKRRILNLPTSAGKSLIQALLTKKTIEESDRSVLILVPTTALVTQMKDDFVDYRLFKADEIAEVRSGCKQTNERVVVATWQSAIKKPQTWFNQFGMLLCDEMHLAIGKSISKKKKKCCCCNIGISDKKKARLV